MDGCYVYLLVDTDPSAERSDEILYVGKGTGDRALMHLREAQLALEDQDAGAAARKLLKIDDTPDGMGVSSNDQGQQSATARREKVTSIQEVLTGKRHVRIDILRSGLTSREAHLVESATIDLLGRERLTNAISGHKSYRFTATTVYAIEKAKEVDLTHDAVIVGVAGVGGGAAPLSGLLGASEHIIWENARRAWAMNKTWVDHLVARSKAGEPALLLAIGIRNSLWGGLVLGVWEIEDLEPQDYHPGDRSRWQFLRSEIESDALRAARALYLGKRLRGVRAQPGVRYSASLRSAAQAPA